MPKNYCVFYVEEPFNEFTAGALIQKDYFYYKQLRTWKSLDALFPFNDVHDKKYDVRDGSDWESVLKPRIRERLNHADNLILILSEDTFQSRSVKEEIEYGIGYLKLPVIVIYTELHEKKDMLVTGKNNVNFKLHYYWNKLPIFKHLKTQVPVLHVPFDKEMVAKALKKNNFVKSSYIRPNNYMLMH
ncbi:TIR domain-containing protein [Snodgrassella alvi]|uniref:TIR domain-containing protein n=1 Tax=Snodgrassella alvi TaxID=1196083 RepID=UPI000C1F096F|nr:TIR domain-containing protein [Snodgrassella alvi]PIT12852.1 hypothetical protein BGI33_12185 [Snodgrassella alvi]PIT17171.1 hypothetical protein BGI34_07780 [Snodgrassella alvi]